MSIIITSSAVTTFDPDHYLHPLRQVVHHPAVLLFFESILKNDTVFQNIVSGNVGGKHVFKPSYPLAGVSWAVVQTLSDIMLAAVHNVTPYPGKRQRSMVIPESAFEELGISSPHDLDLARFHCLPNFLLNLYCNTPDEPADEITKHYYTDDGGALTRYISPSVRYFPDITAWLHFPYDPRYSSMDFLNSLPSLITDISQDDDISFTVASAPSSPATLIDDDDFDNNVKDKDMEDITYLMGNLSLTSN
ncbi:uncharacterized protein ARMOST_21729 [Armillaria ostoyae]|uniref:Uncharacterized protein n=1 Tax=Armillaria ostoyae TaxID=47428 RepID=A0A284SAZ8_ARMOS|nr:uncharacterized protein ARMOST_21729 [Armillaria ostoyae]